MTREGITSTLKGSDQRGLRPLDADGCEFAMADNDSTDGSGSPPEWQSSPIDPLNKEADPLEGQEATFSCPDTDDFERAARVEDKVKDPTTSQGANCTPALESSSPLLQKVQSKAGPGRSGPGSRHDKSPR